MTRIRLGVVGLGSIARKAHLPVLAAHPQVEIIGLASRSGAQVEPLAAQYRLDLTARTFDEVIAARPDAAYLLSATAAHVEQAVALLHGGIHLFMEKPLANTIDEATRILDAAERSGRLLMVGFNRRFAPAYRKAKALFAESGRPIELVVIQKHRNGDHSGWGLRQLVMDDAIHIIDLARFFGGGNLRRMASSARVGRVAAQLQGDDALVQLSQTYGAGGDMERLELHGGGLSVTVEQLERMTVREGGVERVVSLFGSWTSTLEKRGIAGELEHFLGCVRDGAQPETNGVEALATQGLAEEILVAGG